VKQFQALRLQVGGQKGNAGSASAGPIEASDQSTRHWIAAVEEHNRNTRCCCYRGVARGIAAGRNDDAYRTANEISSHRRQPIILTLRPPIFD
jgi:hypothetical protein